MYQQTVIFGNLGAAPEMRYMPDGTAVTNFSVATNRRWTDPASGEPKQETTWWRVSAWGRQAETCNEYLEKGQQVMVIGRIQSDPDTGGPRLYTRQDGSVGSSFELRAFQVIFGNKERRSDFADSHEEHSPTEEDEIPF